MDHVTIHEIAGIRRFDDYGIQQQIDAALSRLPDEAKGAVVAYATQSGAALAVCGRVGDQWSVVVSAHKSYSGPLEAAAAVRFVW